MDSLLDNPEDSSCLDIEATKKRKKKHYCCREDKLVVEGRRLVSCSELDNMCMAVSTLKPHNNIEVAVVVGIRAILGLVGKDLGGWP